MSRLLVVVDYQNDFVEGSLGFDEAKKLEHIILKKAKEYLENGDSVVFTMDTHYENYLNTYEGHNLPVEHCIFDTYGWNLYGKLYKFFEDNKYNEKVQMFEKDTFGCYLLAAYLTNMESKFDEIEFCGVVTNMCVISNAIIAKTITPETKITIDASACSSFNLELHNKALDIMENMHMNIINR